jgi:hypothetical protein
MNIIYHPTVFQTKGSTTINTHYSLYLHTTTTLSFLASPKVQETLSTNILNNNRREAIIHTYNRASISSHATNHTNPHDDIPTTTSDGDIAVRSHKYENKSSFSLKQDEIMRCKDN